MKKRQCRKCGQPFKGYGSVCDCIMDVLTHDRKGQKGIFTTASQEMEVEDDMAYVRKLFNLPPEDAPVPDAILHAWISNRCMTRKACDDWAGLKALYRDFAAYQKHQFTAASFKEAVEKAGYAIDKGMVSRILLRCDYEAMQVRPL